MTKPLLAAILAALALALARGIAFADASDPASAATPAPSPTPAPGSLRLAVDAHLTFISSASSGPGIVPAEGAAFAAGSPLSPLTPYDTFSSAPLVSGNAGESAFYLKPAYYGRGLDVSALIGVAAVSGSVTNAAYWGEPLSPTLNPHVGSQMLPYRIAFPAHAGQDDGSAFSASLLAARIATKDGNLALRAGWFDLAQTQRFVFVQPAVPNVAPAIALATSETLGDGAATLDAWTPSASVLPLHGVDLVAKHGVLQTEFTDAALPSLPGTGARMQSASFVIDHGEGTRYAAMLLHVATGGDAIGTTVLFGGTGGLIPTPQGDLPATTIGGQRQTIAGVSAAFHAAAHVDGVAEYGRSSYDAHGDREPGTARPGNYYHLGATRSAGPDSVSLDLYRNESYYATALLPYGIPENVWSVAWSWPGQWLKSNYQLLDNAPVNVDRQGYRARYRHHTDALDVRAAYANFGEIDPITLTNARRTGFVDGFFLPQADDAATLGRQHQYGLLVGWHPRFADVTFDYTEDTMRRPAIATRPQDAVSYDTPEYVLSTSKKLRPTLLASLGFARYAMRGTFAQPYTNVDFRQRTGIAGIEWTMTRSTSTLLSIRRSAFDGLPAALGDPRPDFVNTLLAVEERLRF